MPAKAFAPSLGSASTFVHVSSDVTRANRLAQRDGRLAVVRDELSVAPDRITALRPRNPKVDDGGMPRVAASSAARVRTARTVRSPGTGGRGRFDLEAAGGGIGLAPESPSDLVGPPGVEPGTNGL